MVCGPEAFYQMHRTTWCFNSWHRCKSSHISELASVIVPVPACVSVHACTCVCVCVCVSVRAHTSRVGEPGCSLPPACLPRVPRLLQGPAGTPGPEGRQGEKGAKVRMAPWMLEHSSHLPAPLAPPGPVSRRLPHIHFFHVEPPCGNGGPYTSSCPGAPGV